MEPLDAQLRIFFDAALACDTLAHNGPWAPFATLRVRASAASAVLSAVRRPQLAAGVVVLPSWCGAHLADAHGVEVCPERARSLAVTLSVEQTVPVERDVLARCALRAVVHAGAVEVGQMVGVPVAGLVAVLRVVQVVDGAASTSVQLVAPAATLTPLQGALLHCYGAQLRPRLEALVRARERGRLLLVAHAALLPLVLCELLLGDLPNVAWETVDADAIVLEGRRVRQDTRVVVLSGLEALSGGDAHVVARWLERLADPVVVVAVVHALEEVERDLVCPSRFGPAIRLHSPTETQRRDLMGALLVRSVVAASSQELSDAARVTGGFSVRDLQRFCQVWSSTGSLAEARARVMPSVMVHEHRFEPSGATWDDVKGCAHVRRVLERAISWPILHPERLAALRCTAPSGVLLHGPPGCGKTMCVNAFARECAVNLVQVRATQLLSKYTGQTEAAIRRLFSHARTLAPCVLLFDELDTIAPSRTAQRAEDSGGAVERLVSTLLNELDGIDTMSGTTGVYVIACTTRPWALDAAIVRPGRLDRLVFVGPPDGATRVELMVGAGLARTDAEQLAWLLEGMTSAAVVSLVRESGASVDGINNLLGKYSVARVPARKVEKYVAFAARKVE